MEAIRPGVRALRAAFFALLCVTLSSTSHVLLADAPLPLPAVGGAFAAVFCLAYLATGRPEAGYWTLAGLMVPLELAVDTLLTSGQQACYGPAGGPVTGSWRSFHEAVLCGGGHVGPAPASGLSAVPGGARATAAVAAAGALPWLLLAVHVCVGLLAALWLRRGESALHQVLRAAGAAALRPLLLALAAFGGASAAPSRTPRRRVPVAAPSPPSSRLLQHAVVRRGPPVAVVC